ncbi:MAG: YraN family protein [Caldilineae bacterium]|nr:MAG: YraN family protein [Caldilineae bacterium]
MDRRRAVGRAGEDLAVEALEAAGLRIIQRNWRCAAGELDVVAEELGPDFVTGAPAAPWLVFVEVRTRRGFSRGNALDAFPPAKQAKLREVAAQYVQEVGWTGPWRIDAVAVQLDAQGRLLDIQHIRHAVSG